MPEIACRKLLGSGSFGRVFESVVDGEKYAIKVETATAKVPQLKYEYKVLRSLKGLRGVPAAYYAWEQPCGETWMVIQLLGNSLERERPTLEETLRIGPAYIRILQGIHDRGYLHRDVKPDNMLRGLSGHTYWLVDYGLAKKYITSKGEHIAPLVSKAPVGTPRFLSRHIHAGNQSSRRDDMESLGYSLVFLVTRVLPWMSPHKLKDNVPDPDQKRTTLARIAACKAKTSVKELCQGLPKAFEFYFERVRDLAFEEKPNYDELCNLFEKCVISQ